MPARRIFIQHEHLAEEFPAARTILKTNALIETLCAIDQGCYGFTITGLRIMEVMELTLALFMETSKQLRNMLLAGRASDGFVRFDDFTSEQVVFMNSFALFVASVQAADELTGMLHEEVTEENQVNGSDGETRARYNHAPVTDTFKMNEIQELIRLDSETLSRKLIRDYQSYIHFYRDHQNPSKKISNIQDVLRYSIRYFSLWKNSLTKLVADSTFDLYRHTLEETEIFILGKDYEGFTYMAGHGDDDSQLMKVTLEDVIGNEEYLNAAKKLALDVAGFDFSSWENPKNINPILFALGNPGCGKTVTAHAIGNFFLNFCKEHGIRARFVIIRRTDWASSYQNASATQLLDIFKRNILQFKGVVGVYWPDIDTAFAARDESGIRNEEKNILGTVFGLFDGTILPKNGQWFMLCDANYMNMDKATISRITQDPYQVKGPEQPEDYVMLLRDVKLRKHRDFLKISDEDWLKFGQKCIDCGLSGRSIENMSRKVVSRIEDFEYPIEYFKADIAKKKEIIRQYSKTISYDELIALTDNYIQFEKDAEEKAARRRFEDRVREITTYLGAERVARATLLGAGSEADG